ncbi:MAG: hypothetical protein AAGE52_29875 [Myxococcota bacterium]
MPSADAELIERCAQGDINAWKAFEARFERLVELIALRVFGARRESIVTEEVHSATERVWEALHRDDGAILQRWKGNRLDAYLAVLVRHEVELYALDETPLSGVSCPTVEHEVTATIAAAAERVASVLERLTPRAAAMVRLRQRGLRIVEIAATLGQPQLSVAEDLDRVALRLAKAQDLTDADIVWRFLLDCSSANERVRIALRTEDDADFRAARRTVDATWQAMRDRTLLELKPRTPGPLHGAQGVATFVDGSMKGAERTRAEGHLATCQRSVDVVAALVMDLQAIASLRPVSALSHSSALVAACLTTGHYATALGLANASSTDDPLRRLAQVGVALGGQSGHEDRSRVHATTTLPDDDEAPIAAFEALVGGDATAAYRAIDEVGARLTIGQRLRLLAMASGPDLPLAKEAAQAIQRSASPDPGLMGDAVSVSALPSGRGLPREVLVDRLHSAMPDAVRFVASR